MGNFEGVTVCDFRALHLKELAALFVQVVRLASECGLVNLGTIAIDGTKIKANARHKQSGKRRGVGSVNSVERTRGASPAGGVLGELPSPLSDSLVLR